MHLLVTHIQTTQHTYTPHITQHPHTTKHNTQNAHGPHTTAHSTHTTHNTHNTTVVLTGINRDRQNHRLTGSVNAFHMNRFFSWSFTLSFSLSLSLSLSIYLLYQKSLPAEISSCFHVFFRNNDLLKLLTICRCCFLTGRIAVVSDTDADEND